MPPNSTISKGNNNPFRLQDILRYILGYSFFLVFLLLAAVLLFRLRINFIQIAFLLGYNQVQVKGIANLGVLFSGILLLAGVIFAEDYLRKGMIQNDLWKRALRLFLFEGGFLLFSFLLYWLLLSLAV